jgi:hypothetical protein
LEAQEINMPHTLRRKMFKLGGDVSKSHGVGLTSGLKFNKGGKVAPVGSDVYPKAMGPDGQMREAHNLGMILAPAGAIARSGAGLLSKGLGKLAPSALSKFGSKGGIGNFISGGRLSAKEVLKRTRGKGYTDAEKYRLFGNLGFGPQGRAMQALRASGVMSTAGTGLGVTSALADRFGLMEEGNDDSRLESLFRGAGKMGLDYSYPGMAYGTYQYLMGSKDNPKDPSLTRLISGKDANKPIAKATTKEQIESEEEAMDKMQAEANKKVEQYYQMLGGGRKTSMMDVSKMLLAAAPLVAEGDYAGGMKAAGDVAIENVEMDQKIGQEAALMTIKELQQTDLMREEGINKLIAAGEIDSAKEGKRLFSAAEQTGGIENMPQDLPMKGNKEDSDLIQANTVYVDLKNYSGKLFVAYDGSKQPFPTSDYQAALSIAKA